MFEEDNSVPPQFCFNLLALEDIRPGMFCYHNVNTGDVSMWRMPYIGGPNCCEAAEPIKQGQRLYRKDHVLSGTTDWAGNKYKQFGMLYVQDAAVSTKPCVSGISRFKEAIAAKDLQRAERYHPACIRPGCGQPVKPGNRYCSFLCFSVEST